MEKNDDVDVIEILRIIIKYKKLLLRVLIVASLLGVFIAFTSKVEFVSTCKLLPEQNDVAASQLGGLSSIAGLAGINLDVSSKGSLTPDIYPVVVKSIPFQLKLMHTKIKFDAVDTLISVHDFFEKVNKPSITKFILDYTILLPFKVKKWFAKESLENRNKNTNPNIIGLSQSEIDLMEVFEDKIAVNVDNETGVISVKVYLPDARACAEIANEATLLLKEYVVDYKVSKVKQNLEFVSVQNIEAFKRYEQAQIKLAEFTDRNKNVITANAEIGLKRLQNEYNLAFELYKGLSSQLEQAKIKVKEQTPIFTVLQPALIPLEKDSPKRSIILIVSVFFGLSGCFFWIIVKETYFPEVDKR